MIKRVDYLPILSPSDEIKDDVSHYKMDSSIAVGKYPGMKGTAHITMRDDLMNKDFYLTEPLVLAYEKKLEEVYSIDLTTNGFDNLKSSSGGTIYLGIEQSPLYQLWFNILKTILNNRRRSFTPHITVTKNIKHELFEKLWTKFQNIGHKRAFRIDKLTILKRETFNRDSHYEIFKEFRFRDEVFTEELAMKHFHKRYLNEKFPSQQYHLF
jgi:2'-5' RNA ligase